MKRKDFVDAVINIIGNGCNPTGEYRVYCDHTQSEKPENQNTYFMRLKYPCFSDNVHYDFCILKEKIWKYLQSIGEYKATIHYRKTYNYYYKPKTYYYVEIVFHNGKPWCNKKNQIETYSLKKQNQVEECPKECITGINKSAIAKLIRKDIENNVYEYGEYLVRLTDDDLIDIFNKFNKISKQHE